MEIFTIDIHLSCGDYPLVLGKNALLVGYNLPYNLWQKVASVCLKLPCPLEAYWQCYGNNYLQKWAFFPSLGKFWEVIISLDTDFISIEK
jgi:hypothetical protein